MAEMRPEHPTFGEEAKIGREDVAFGLLRDNLPADSIVLYSPFIFNRRNQARNPDFIVLHPEFGVAVIEVKNWNLDTIVSVDSTCVKTKEGALKISRPLPIQQAKSYVHDLQSHLRRECGADPDIIRQSGPKKGAPVFFIGHFVAFMNTTDDDLGKIVEKFNRTMVQDDILTEESLDSPHRILACLRARAGKTRISMDVLRKIAAAVTPSNSSQTDIVEKAEHKRVELLPDALYKFVSPRAGLDPFARFNELKADLVSVCTDSHNIVCADNPDGVRAKKIGLIRDGIVADRFQIGLFGETTAGKSTFINSLFGEELLLPGRGETTKTLTRIMRPDGEHADRDTVVHYKTWEDIDREVDEYVGGLLRTFAEANSLAIPTVNLDGTDIPDISNAATIEIVRDIVDKHREEFRSSDLKNQVKFLDALAAGWEPSRENVGKKIPMPLDESKTLCGKENNAIYIEKCDIHLDNKFVTENNIVLIDSPGFGSSLARHSRLALDTAIAVDAAIMLTSAARPLMEAEQRFIKELQGMRAHGKLSNLVYILNKIGEPDRNEGGQEFRTLNEFVDSMRDELRKKLYNDLDIADPVIYAVDSKCALQAQLVQKGDERAKKAWDSGKAVLTENREDLQGNLDASGFPKMLEGLSRRLQANKIVDFLGAKQSALLGELELFKSDIQKEIDGMSTDLERLLKVKKQHEDAKKIAKVTVDEFVDFTIPGKISKKHENLEKEVENFVSKDIHHIIIGHILENYLKYTKKKLSSADFWTALMSDNALLRALEATITNKRKHYHDEYAIIRDENKTILTREILAKSYGENLQWDYPYEEAKIDALKSVSTITSLRPSFFQDMKAGIASIVNFFASFLDFIIFDVRKWMAEYLSANYFATCKDAIKADILEWIKRDSSAFAAASKKSFDDLMNAIEEGLENSINNCNDKEAERDARQKNLEYYRHEIDKTVESLAELNREIKKLNP